MTRLVMTGRLMKISETFMSRMINISRANMRSRLREWRELLVMNKPANGVPTRDMDKDLRQLRQRSWKPIVIVSELHQPLYFAQTSRAGDPWSGVSERLCSRLP